MSRLGLRFHLQRRLLSPRLRRIRLLVCDVDGVLTDGGLHYDEQGRVVKRFDVRDGLAIRMLQWAAALASCSLPATCRADSKSQHVLG